MLTGKLAKIDLDTGRIDLKSIYRATRRDYLGGIGLNMFFNNDGSTLFALFNRVPFVKFNRADFQNQTRPVLTEFLG